jgi:hypothetical protein
MKMKSTPRGLVTAALLLIVAATVGVAVRDEVRQRGTAPAQAAPSITVPEGETKAARPKLIVYYFHTATRCVSCLKIENLTQFTLESDFSSELVEGLIEWRPVNLDTPGNGHFAKEYGLYTKSVVLSEVRDGRETRWRNLEKVWHLLPDPEGFRRYVEEEVRSFRAVS